MDTTIKMTSTHLKLFILPETLAVCRLEAEAVFPEWARSSSLVALVRTGDEVSVVCDQDCVPADITAVSGWRALGVEGPLDFSLVGVLAALTTTLAEAGVSIFALSTYNTDYILVKENRLDLAVHALREAGHDIQG